MNMQNSLHSKCVICDKSLEVESLLSCVKCQKICESIMNMIEHKPTDKLGIYDVKSKCCNADVTFASKTTCSPDCHEKFVNEMESIFGKFKQVVDQPSGISYKVPTRYIIEHGINQNELISFPKWDN